MSHAAIGAIGALTNRVQQPHTLLILGLNAGMSTAVGADELVEILTDVEHPIGTEAHLLLPPLEARCKTKIILASP